MTFEAGADAAQTVTTYVPNTHLMSGLLGPRDEYLRVVERAYPQCKIRVQGNRISVEGADAAKVLRLFDELVLVLEAGQSLDPSKVTRTIDMVEDDLRPSEVLRHEVVRGAKGKPVRPSTAGQKRYTDAIDASTVTFAIGPAGTGKSYLAVAAAVQALHRRQVQRIVLTRPAVEAGERLGFLPGDLMAKVDPYLRPLYDALYDMVGAEGAQRLIGNGSIEIAPLAFMRGRTLNDSFIILDEAQNTTPEQMKMFLTRIGFNSKAVVTGDVTQIDLGGKPSGLERIERILWNVEGYQLRAPGVQGRRAPQDRRGHRRRLRARDPVIDVYVADEQHDHPIDLERWCALAQGALADEGVAGLAEVSLIFADEHDLRAQHPVHGPRGPDRRPELPIDNEPEPSGRVPDAGGTGPGEPPTPEIPSSWATS